MRGPLESLILRKPGKELFEKRFPHRFLPGIAAVSFNACRVPER